MRSEEWTLQDSLHVRGGRGSGCCLVAQLIMRASFQLPATAGDDSSRVNHDRL